LATITKRDGGSYKIVVSCGYNDAGRQVRRFTTFKPAPGLTEKQIEKELQAAAIQLETKCAGGYAPRLFIACDGSPLFPTMLNKWLRRFLSENGLPPVSVHSLRHTCISLQIIACVPLTEVSRRAGHSSAAITAAVYSQ
jgi:integrase